MLARISGTLALALVAACGSNGNTGDGNGDTPDAAGPAVDAPPVIVTTAVAIPLTQDGGGYSAKMSIGGQAFDVLVDTGSSTTGVAASTCTNCSVHPEYAPGTAMDLGFPASSQYGLGSWKGEVFEDAATMGGESPVMLDFASITSQTQFFHPGSTFQGILGLGPDGLLLAHTTSYITKLFASGVPGQLAFQLCPDGGTMWLGGFDASAATTAPSFTAMGSQAPYYIVNVGSASTSTTASLTSADFGPTIIDTGTTQTFVPAAALAAVISGVKGSSNYASVFGSQDFADGSCMQTSMSSAQIDAALPKLSLSFSGQATPMELPATSSYLFEEQPGYFCVAFSDSSQLFGGQKVSLFGNTLLASMLTVFDVENKKIGFAPQAGCASADKVTTPRILRRPSLAKAHAILHDLGLAAAE